MTMIFHLSRVIDAGGLMDAGGPPGRRELFEFATNNKNNDNR
jgi:hypothetical protein